MERCHETDFGKSIQRRQLFVSILYFFKHDWSPISGPVFLVYPLRFLGHRFSIFPVMFEHLAIWCCNLKKRELLQVLRMCCQKGLDSSKSFQYSFGEIHPVGPYGDVFRTDAEPFNDLSVLRCQLGGIPAIRE